MKVPTEKQKKRLGRIIERCGSGVAKEKFYKLFPKGHYEQMTRAQMQRLITSLHFYEDRPIIRGVVGRDLPFSRRRF